ncbi:MAG: hypothetical protein QG565_1358 [Campylobacterota bacterium]|nr:hypothetical protein [Campylobacterota bacterium]MDQ1268389.1 hypothetical protein [Campylobacterota bacterium]MDQ1338732.1 hypothetical protein [Campylobacterota bacterium]
MKERKPMNKKAQLLWAFRTREPSVNAGNGITSGTVIISKRKMYDF